MVPHFDADPPAFPVIYYVYVHMYGYVYMYIYMDVYVYVCIVLVWMPIRLHSLSHVCICVHA